MDQIEISNHNLKSSLFQDQQWHSFSLCFSTTFEFWNLHDRGYWKYYIKIQRYSVTHHVLSKLILTAKITKKERISNVDGKQIEYPRKWRFSNKYNLTTFWIENLVLYRLSVYWISPRISGCPIDRLHPSHLCKLTGHI